MRRSPATVAVVAVALGLAGCTSTAPTVTVSIGDRTETLEPTQYCLDGEPEIYSDQPAPPVFRVAARTSLPVRITVPAEVAADGWQVQVFNSDLSEQIGQVDAGTATTFAEIETGDSEPPEYYLVIVQNAGESCDGLSGAWPVGIVRS